MNLTTRCPSCGTAFRVQPAQLSARGGKVRCGKCGNVFDGVTALVAEGTEQGEGLPRPDNEPSPQLGLFEAREDAGGGRRGQRGCAGAGVPRQEPPPPRRRAGWALLAACSRWLRSPRRRPTTSAPRSRYWFPKTRPYLEARLRAGQMRAAAAAPLQAHGDRILRPAGRRPARQRDRAERGAAQPGAVRAGVSVARADADRRARRSRWRGACCCPRTTSARAGAEQIARGIGPGADAVLRVYFDTSGLRAVGYRLYLFFP